MENQQNEKKQSIFRKKAMDRISSPEELDQYLTVTGPGVWFPLIAVIILLIGGLVWMTLGHIDVTLGVAVMAKEDGIVCYVPAENKAAAVSRGTVKIGDQTYPLTDIGMAPLLVSDDTDENVRRTGALMLGMTVAPLKVEAELMEGIYAGQITVESVNPITYIIN